MASEQTDPAAEFPQAVLVPDRRNLVPWILPALALIAALGLLVSAWRSSGPSITVRFDSGYGLRAGDPVRTRGIQVGEVERVRLDSAGNGVLVEARLDPSAGNLTRVGTRFWIAHPVVGPAGVSDLDTLVGPRYLAAMPSEQDGTRTRVFRGLENAPLGEAFSGGLEVLLEARERRGLSAGAPVLYRQMPVGEVIGVALSADRSRVEVRAVIGPQHAELVRENSSFWIAGGLELKAGLLEGLELRFDSLQGLLTGAVAFATPNAIGGAAATGARFELASQEPENALAWTPNLPVGNLSLALGSPAPEPLRTALAWKAGSMIAFQERKTGWSLRGENCLIGPADLLRAPSDARSGSARLEVDGIELSVLPRLEVEGKAAQKAADKAARLGSLVRLPLPEDPGGWPAGRERRAEAPEDLLVFGAASEGARAIDAERLTPVAGQRLWELDRSLAFPADWHGAPVLGRSDARLIGCLIVHQDGARIALLAE